MPELCIRPTAASGRAATPKGQALVGWKPSSTRSHVASARLRCTGPASQLRRTGFPVELYRENIRLPYRIVVLQKLYDCDHLELVRRLKSDGTRVVLDICDNHLYNPHGDPQFAAQADQLLRMLDIADDVTVPTIAMANALPRSATVIPDGLEPAPAWSRFRVPRSKTEPLDLVWFGNWGGSRAPHGNPDLAPFGMRDILTIADELIALSRECSIRLTVISNRRSAFQEWIAGLPFPTRYREWRSHGNLCRLLPLHDLCILPCQVNPFTVCKSNNRIALALALGVPVAATSIPSYEDLRPYCVLDDWERGLRATIDDSAAQQKCTEQGRAHILRHYSAAHIAENWRTFFERCLVK